MSTFHTSEYIRKGLKVMLIGATGYGKTYLAYALSNNACLSEYRTSYFRPSDSSVKWNQLEPRVAMWTPSKLSKKSQ
ncbi:MAG: hypothetical protein EOM12_02615 [Verrucomicrobiae bacterium]|nr:hypothetical protein [Verrucomicrobiae bacterium]